MRKKLERDYNPLCVSSHVPLRQVSSGVPQYLTKDYIIGLTQNVANSAVKLLVLFIAFVSDVKVYTIGLATDS